MSSTDPMTDDGVIDDGVIHDRAVDERATDDAPVPPGRPVRLVPTPPGFWRAVGGVIVAMLAPFFGILIGSTMGSTEGTGRMDPLYWGFFIGCVLGALGLVSLGLGARTMIRAARSAEPGTEPEAESHEGQAP